MDPKECPYCKQGTGEGSGVTYAHETAGCAVACEECGMRGPQVEGMDRAAKLWNSMSIRAQK